MKDGPQIENEMISQMVCSYLHLPLSFALGSSLMSSSSCYNLPLSVVCPQCGQTADLSDAATAAAERFLAMLPERDVSEKKWIETVHRFRRTLLGDDDECDDILCRSCAPPDVVCPLSFEGLTLQAYAKQESVKFPELYEAILAEVKKDNPLLLAFEQAYQRRQSGIRSERGPATHRPKPDAERFDNGSASKTFNEQVRAAEEMKREKRRHDQIAKEQVGQMMQKSVVQEERRCDCGLVCKPQISKSEKNAGRPFIGCPNFRKPNKCKFFEFLDEEGQREKQQRLEGKRGGTSFGARGAPSAAGRGQQYRGGTTATGQYQKRNY